MGTRADFYIGTGPKAEWLGSIAWDGHPESMPEQLIAAKTETEFRLAVSIFHLRDDWTSPDDGWPWPWDDSRTTDYAYAFRKAAVRFSCFGSRWRALGCDKRYGRAVFPNMKHRQKVTFGRRSGIMVFG